jgi:hypothetical protein
MLLDMSQTELSFGIQSIGDGAAKLHMLHVVEDWNPSKAGSTGRWASKPMAPATATASTATAQAQGGQQSSWFRAKSSMPCWKDSA